MESFATGLKRIYDACTVSGVKVEFKREPYGFTVRFHRHCGEGWGEVVHGSASDAQPNAQPMTKADQILAYCVIPRTMKEIQKMLNVKDPRTARKYVHQLIESKKIGMTIPDTPNHPEQRYVTLK